MLLRPATRLADHSVHPRRFAVSLAWSRQLDSELARDHRLVAMDLRGHGLSEKPRDAYGDSRLWADDVRAVIDALNLDRPVLCGWSHGPLVIRIISGITARTGLAASTLSAALRSLAAMRRCPSSLPSG